MKSLVENKFIMIPLLLAIILCVIGGDITEWISKNSYLASWIESNKIENSYNGLDFSGLVICAALAIAITISFITQELLEGVLNVIEIFSNGKNQEESLTSGISETTNQEKKK